MSPRKTAQLLTQQKPPRLHTVPQCHPQVEAQWTRLEDGPAAKGIGLFN